MQLFEPGKVIKTVFGAPIKIVKYLASGGQGDVYIVEYGGAKKALKWYKPQVMRDPDAFYENLKRNAAKGSPDKAFLWPDAVTERTEGSFGYIVDLMPENYYTLGEVLASNKHYFTSYLNAIDACIRIINAFRKLHNRGYCYADIHEGYFFINPKTGDVLIADADSIVPSGSSVGVLQSLRYSAPEIVESNGQPAPDVQSERHSLAVILFIILFLAHPLEGRQWASAPCISVEVTKKLYGASAVFIFDPTNDTNRQVNKIQDNTMRLWNAAPDYLKDMCIQAFSSRSLMEPSERPMELDWLRVLVRLRSGVARCSCGSEVFVNGAGKYQCDYCKKAIVIKNALILPTYSIAAQKGAYIYRCQLGVCNAEDALEPILLVVANKDGALGVKNITPKPIKAYTPSQKEKIIAPGMIVPFIAGISIEVYGKKIVLN